MCVCVCGICIPLHPSLGMGGIQKNAPTHCPSHLSISSGRASLGHRHRGRLYVHRPVACWVQDDLGNGESVRGRLQDGGQQAGEMWGYEQVHTACTKLGHIALTIALRSVPEGCLPTLSPHACLNAGCPPRKDVALPGVLRRAVHGPHHADRVTGMCVCVWMHCRCCLLYTSPSPRDS